MKVIDLPANRTPETLAENFLELTQDGEVKCVVMAILMKDGSLKCEWSFLPNNLVAIGMTEMLKQTLVEQ
jgi:hypothetical protein